MKQLLKPSSDYPAWMVLDYEALISNLARFQKSSNLLNLDIKPLRKVWPEIYEDFYRNGVTGIFCRDPRGLFVDPLTQLKVLVPPYPSNLLGYSKTEFIPVLSNYKECLLLSNMAQTQDFTQKFLLRVNSLEAEFSAGNYGLLDIIERSENLPMIDCTGFYLEKDISLENFKSFVTPLLMKKSFSITDLTIISASLNVTEENIFKPIGIELLGVNPRETISSAINIGCWVYPKCRKQNTTITSIDLGTRNGLNDNFPVLLQGNPGTVKSCELYRTEIEFPGALTGAFPWKAVLCGNEKTDIVSPTEWHSSNLITLINNWEYPVYLLKDGTYTEYLP